MSEKLAHIFRVEVMQGVLASNQFLFVNDFLSLYVPYNTVMLVQANT